jgi:RNase P/RNase MRP subunit p29
MPHNIQNIYAHELIGLEAAIESISCHHSPRVQGIIIDETKNMFTLMHKAGKMKIPKHKLRLHLTLPNQRKVVLDGTRLINRPEDRIKIFRRT